MLSNLKYYISRIPNYISIAIQLHSKSPNKEIKKLWEVFAIGGLPVAFLTLFSGEKIFFLKLPKINIINDYGGFIFFFFVIVYVIVFFDYKKCKEITKELTAKNLQKHEKS